MVENILQTRTPLLEGGVDKRTRGSKEGKRAIKGSGL